MQVFLGQDGKQTGPFTLEQVMAMSSEGALIASTLAWHAGMNDWAPVAELLRTENVAPQPMPPPLALPPAPAAAKTPAVGIASFVIGVAGLPIWLVILGLAGFGQVQNFGPESVFMMLVGLALFAMIGVNLVGAVLGFVAAAQKDAKKMLTIFGLTLNLLELVGIVVITAVGLMMK